jgi:hypothetical protein
MQDGKRLTKKDLANLAFLQSLRAYQKPWRVEMHMLSWLLCRSEKKQNKPQQKDSDKISLSTLPGCAQNVMGQQ